MLREIETDRVAGGATDRADEMGHMTRDAAGVITSVDEATCALLNWRPEQMVGSPSTKFIHPADQSSAVAAWMEMITCPGLIRVWRGRYQTGGGTWQWVETENRFDDAGIPVVISSMKHVSPEEATFEEQLQAREQVLSRLSEALPVGVFQLDLEGRVTFTNESFHQIVGVPLRAAFDAQMSSVIDDDRPVLAAALLKALAEQPVDDIEIRLLLPDGDSSPEVPRRRVCQLGLRALTDVAGLVNGVVGCLSDVTDRALLHQQLEVRATIDPLTSCLNRAATIELVDRTLAVEEAGRGRAVIYVDLDGLKAVNDRLGHAAGDRFLMVAAERLRAAARDGDHVGRLGGDEFLVICPGVDRPTQAVDLAQRISSALTATIALGAAASELNASIGVAWTTEPLATDTLIAQADRAMYESKHQGGRSVTLYVDTEGSGDASAARPPAPRRVRSSARQKVVAADG
ncbi:MAG TPA: diguanylate cyclase [Acidimicrobiales bacterium]